MKNLKTTKRILALLLAVFIVSCSMSTIVFADEQYVDVYINGQLLDCGDAPARVVGDGTTMLPFRAIFEALGMIVDFKTGGDWMRIYAYNREADIRIDMYVGEPVLYKSSMKKYDEYRDSGGTDLKEIAEARPIPVAPYEDESIGRTFVPARAIAEAVGAEVLWLGDSNTVAITYDRLPTNGDGSNGSYNYSDVPTFSDITGVPAIMQSGEGDIGLSYRYPYDVNTCNAYLYALEQKGFVKIDGSTNLSVYESSLNTYVYVERISNDILEISIVYDPDYYYNPSGVPNYYYITGTLCYEWDTFDDGMHYYFYERDDDDLRKYFNALDNLGFEPVDVSTTDSGYETEFFYDGTTYIMITLSDHYVVITGLAS